MSVFKKVLIGIVAFLVVCVFAILIFLKVSGAWGALFPSSTHETVAPTLPDNLGQPAILLFTKTNGYRHGEGIEAGSAFFKELAESRGWSIYATENGAVFNEQDLSRFAAVVYLNVSGDVFNSAQRDSFKQWLLSGGGWLGIHAAGDGSHALWPWYVDTLIGAKYTAHPMNPQFQEATVNVESASHPVMHDLPAQYSHKEEWYSWEESPRAGGFTILATIDEDSYSPIQKLFGKETALHMGEDHPIAWSRCVESGRAIYSAMGHGADSYAAKEHQQLLENALDWVVESEGC